MSHEKGFRVALAQQDLFAEKVPESDKNFQRLLAYVDVDNDGQISKEYAMCLQKLKLATLYLTKKEKQVPTIVSRTSTHWMQNFCRCNLRSQMS